MGADGGAIGVVQEVHLHTDDEARWRGVVRLLAGVTPTSTVSNFRNWRLGCECIGTDRFFGIRPKPWSLIATPKT